MRLTTNHLRFYQAKKTPTPKWIAQIGKTPWRLVEPCGVSIDELVNCQDPKRSKFYEAANLCALIKLATRTNGEQPKAYLQKVATHYHTSSSDRRRAFVRKWLKRIERTPS